MPSSYNTMPYHIYKSAEEENKVCKQSLNKTNNREISERLFCHKMFYTLIFIVTVLFIALDT